MVLQGDEEGFVPPFDASLYGQTQSPDTPATEWEIEYEGCEGVGVLFQTSPEVREILPEGVSLFSDPPQASAIVVHYPFSSVGEYHEYISLIQVEDASGEMGYYIPYIYVTNDAALAAGREMIGAPKKLATIDLERDVDTLVGTMERPEGKRLCTVTAKPEERARGGLVDMLFDGETPALSVRHLPPVEGGDGLTQLVKWYTAMEFHETANGKRAVWQGPVDLTYDSHSSIDPIHRIPVEETLAGMYLQFDMRLGATEVQKEWRP